MNSRSSVLASLGLRKTDNYTEVLAALEKASDKDIKKFSAGDWKTISEMDHTLYLVCLSAAQKEDKFTDNDNDFYPLLEKLLKLGANPNAVYDGGINPFLLSCAIHDNGKALSIIAKNHFYGTDPNTYKPIEHQTDTNSCDTFGNNGIYYAAMSGAIGNLKPLVQDFKININSQSLFSQDKTVLHFVCAEMIGETKIKPTGFVATDALCDRSEVLKELLSLGADPRLTDIDRNLPEQLIPIEPDESHAEDEDITKEYLEELKNSLEAAYELVSTTRKKIESSSNQEAKKQYRKSF